MEKSYNLIDALRVLIKWKMPIIIFVVVASIGGIALALLLPEYFKSQVVFYPTNPARTESSVLFSETSTEFAADFFGTKNDVNRLLTIATSSGVVDFMVNHFDLATHYGYDTSATNYKRYKVTEEFKDNYSVLKTENGAIELTILDTDPLLAAEMVNMAAVVIDKLGNSGLVDTKKGVADMFTNAYKEKEAEVQMLADSLAKLKEQYNIELINAGAVDGLPIVRGNDAQMVENYKILFKRQERAIVDLTKIQTLRDQNRTALQQELTSMLIIEPGYPAEKRAKPVRWVICVTTTLISIFLAIAGALLIDRMQYIKRELEHAG